MARDLLKQLPIQDSQIAVSTSHYDLPSFDDFAAIAQRDSGGNTWLIKVKLSRRGKVEEVLLWIGFSSHELERELGLEGAVPSVKLSVVNPDPPPRYTLPSGASSPRAREFIYHG